jgi:hypothetical protein
VVTRGIVSFNAAAFTQAFPAFATIPAVVLNNNFNLATLQLDNSCNSVVQDVGIRTSLFNLLVAHITALLNGINGEPPNGTVGRVGNATQGSVSATFDYVSESESASYYAQTPWGAQFWASTVSYRNGRYIPGPASERFGDSWNAWPE